MQETRETWIRSLGGEDPLEKEIATQILYSCLGNSREIPDRGAWRATVLGVTEETDTTERAQTHTHTHTSQ